MTVLGVIADTHIPDRRQELHPKVLPVFRESEVDAILHAGDVSVPSVLEELGQVAPVYAVRGNRDWWRLGHLPFYLNLSFDGVPILLTHGHGRLWDYLFGKVYYLFYGVQPERFRRRLTLAFPEAKVIIFGHMHIPMNDWTNERLVFNPGTACCPDLKGLPPSVGLLYIQAGGEIEGKILYLS